MGTLPDLTRPNADRIVELGDGISMHHYPDDEWRVRHTCHRAGTRGTIIAAPTLTTGTAGPNHSVVATDPLTVEPSILCGDCGLHGFVRAGVWIAA